LLGQVALFDPENISQVSKYNHLELSGLFDESNLQPEKKNTVGNEGSSGSFVGKAPNRSSNMTGNSAE
jgi:hypothetical protein